MPSLLHPLPRQGCVSGLLTTVSLAAPAIAPMNADSSLAPCRPRPNFNRRWCVERLGSAAAGRATRARGPLQPEVRRLAGTKLLDDFIGATQYRRWDHHPECFRRPEIDEQLEPRGLVHGK